MDAIIHFVITYNEKIIYILGGLICVLSAMIVWWQVFSKKGLKDDQAVHVDLSGIEESLKKILSQTNAAIVATTPQTGAAGGGVELKDIVSSDGKPITDVAGVKSELETRAKMIEDLRKQVKEAKDQDASAELLAKIKGLESRLAEYEIIEDDIADLSVLKEENAKLKKEIESLKRGGGPQMVDQFAQALAEAEGKTAEGAAPTAAATAPSVAGGAAETLENVAPLAAAIEGMLSNESVPEIVAQKPIETKTDQDALMAAAVAAAQSQVDSAATLPNDSSTGETVVFETKPTGDATGASPTQATPAASAAPAEESKGDIFSEFSSDEASEDPMAALGDIDPDKMLEELQDLNMDMSAGAETLDEAPDIDKMAQEATTLSGKKG